MFSTPLSYASKNVMKKSLSYRHQPFDLHPTIKNLVIDLLYKSVDWTSFYMIGCKSNDWFLYEMKGLHDIFCDSANWRGKM